MGDSDFRTKLNAIMRDASLTHEEKAKAMQALQTQGSKWAAKVEDELSPGAKGKKEAEQPIPENLKCAICLSLCERPVTAPCQHNFCLVCFQKWGQQGKSSCPTCRAPFPRSFSQNPRINTALTTAIRLAKNPIKMNAAPAKEVKRIENEDRPDEAFVTEKAQKAGRANASSGKIMVTIPNDHFGPILPEHDPRRNQGVLVGEYWKDRLDCRQWGAHFPHVAGIAGQSGIGAQSVVLSGGYEDDRDEGEWFLYTGSGGRDLSGNKRTNKEQSKDQVFDSSNKALLLSCQKGLPVRVVRSHKEKRSAYAPTTEQPVRYDGIYRILRCWRSKGKQEFLMCRYLFVRCDNSPAPWHGGDDGDAKNLEVPEIAAAEIKLADGGKVYQMCDDPAWDYLDDKGEWGWAKEPPASQHASSGSTRKPQNKGAALKKRISQAEKALADFKCGICLSTSLTPVSTPCGHLFCKECLYSKFEGISDIQHASHERTMRVRKNLKPCPNSKCRVDLCDFLNSAQVNHELATSITKLIEEVAKAKEEIEQLGKEGREEGEEGEEDGEGMEEGEGEEEEEDDEGGQSRPTSASKSKPASASRPSSSAKGSRGRKPSTGNGLAGTSAAALIDQGLSPTAGATAPTAASAPAHPPQGPHAKELEILASEFPSFDRSLIQVFLNDQGGDLLDVRAIIRMTLKETKPKKPRPTSASKPAPKSSGRGSKRKSSKDEGEEESGKKAKHEQEGEEEKDPIEDDE